MKQEADLEYTGFWLRVWASLIDTVLLLLITMPALFAIYGRDYLHYEGYYGPADFVISYVIPAILVIALWSKLGSTPGKMAIGATIVDARTGGKPTVTQFIIRYVGYYLSLLGFFLGFFWIGIDARKQGWHDKLAGTVVVRRKPGAGTPVSFEGMPST
ncbi:MAG: RDD family protein [Telluria sp.]